jgi:mono/diheme cytochrome c family protein
MKGGRGVWREKTEMIADCKSITGSTVRALLWGMGLVLALQLLWACNYGRMNEDEAVHTYQTIMPEMPKRTIPVDGGIQVLRESNPEELLNPIAYNKESVGHGKTAYSHYCIQCHGPLADGQGTVGQSFAPLPANLRDPNVQDQSDGSLFYRISLGINRHPPLWDTVTQNDRWALVNFIRSFARPEES